MPRYLFEVANGSGAQPASLHLPNIQAARTEAVKMSCSILSESAGEFWERGGDWQMTVADERGLTLFTLTFYATNAPAAAASCMNGDRRPL